MGPTAARKGGFTLVEMMVVMMIIGVLAALLLGVLPAVMGGSKAKAALTEIQRLAHALSEYEAYFNDYPPSRLAVAGGNGINDGIESLVASLSSRTGKGPYHGFEDAARLVNIDADKAAKPLAILTGSAITSAELFEYADPFGRPYVYFHGRDLTSSFSARYSFGAGTVDCRPAPPDKTGRFPGSGQYQILSAGDNGTYEQGGGDDITSWGR